MKAFDYHQLLLIILLLKIAEPHKTPDSCLDTEISEKNLCKRSKGIYGENTLAYPRTLSRYRGSKA